MKKIFTAFAASILFCAATFAQDATIYLWRKVKGMEKQPSVMFMHKPVENSPKYKNRKNGVTLSDCHGKVELNNNLHS